jgi:hypothetical protein
VTQTADREFSLSTDVCGVQLRILPEQTRRNNPRSKLVSPTFCVAQRVNLKQSMTAMLNLLAVTLLFATQQTYTLKPDLRIGAFDGDAAFGSIVAVALDRHKRIFVADGMEKRVKVFDASGKYVRAIGRPGRGPGDFESLKRLGVIGDTLWVTEYNGRTSSFNAVTGRFIRMLTPGSANAPQGSAYSPGVGALQILEEHSMRAGPSPLVIARLRDRRADTLVSLPRRNNRLTVLHQGRPVYQTTQPFSDDPIAALDPHGKYAVVASFPTPARNGVGAYELTLYDVSTANVNAKQPTKRRSFAYRASPLTDQYFDEWLKRFLKTGRGPYFPKDGEAAMRKATYRPKWHRPIGSIKIANDGRIWLRHNTPRDVVPQWTILNPDFTSYGTIAIPDDRGYLLDADKDFVWLVEYDEEDVPQLIRARLVRKP